jgi:hypothetical protein
MLLDSRLVPQTIIRPNSFVGLMALYESNYLRLLHLVPELERLDGCFRSRVAGDCELFVDVLDRSRYTITLALTYHFETEEGRLADPDMQVRVYLDGCLGRTRGIWFSNADPVSRQFPKLSIKSKFANRTIVIIRAGSGRRLTVVIMSRGPM